MERVKAAYSDKDIHAMREPGKGKTDAIFSTYLPREAMRTRAAGTIAETWTVLGSGKEEFINGSRLVYPLQRDF